MTFNRKFFLCAAVLSVIPSAWTYPRTKPLTDRQVVSIPAEGVDVSEMLLVADHAHSLLFLKLPEDPERTGCGADRHVPADGAQGIPVWQAKYWWAVSPY